MVWGGFRFPVDALPEDPPPELPELPELLLPPALEEQLPGLRCGSCGAPSCHAFAEDVVMGRADEEDCIFKVRARMQHMAEGADPDEYLPAPFRRRRPGGKAGHSPEE